MGRVGAGERHDVAKLAGKSRADTPAGKEKSFEGITMDLPLVVALNCMDDCSVEAEALAGVAVVEHVGLAHVGEGKIEAAVAVLVQSLAYLPRAAQRRLQPWQLILSLGCADKLVDSGLANDLGLQLLHVDSGRSEEVADTAMALLLALLRRTPALAAQAGASAYWLGALPAACRGMRRCRGRVLGIIGATAAACALATRCLAFNMQVFYYDPDEERGGAQRGRRSFPPTVRKVDSLKELLSFSDVVSLHCLLTNETLQIINEESLQYIKPGALVVNTSSSHLLDDCALKQALIEGRVGGCALDGVEGPQWLEAWVREMPNVLILPRSADYSEEVWAEIRAKAVSVLKSFLLDGVIPSNTGSDDEDLPRDSVWQDDKQEKVDKGSTVQLRDGDQQSGQDFRQKQIYFQSQERSHSQETEKPHVMLQRDSRSNHLKGSGKKTKKRTGRRKAPQQNTDVFTVPERESNWAALPCEDHDNTGATGRDIAPTSNSRFASPEDSKLKREADGAPARQTITENLHGYQGIGKGTRHSAALDFLTEGQIVALRTRPGGGYYVARQRGPGRGWHLDTMVDVTCRDPAAQFLVVVRNRDRIGLRSLAAGGKLLQANKKLELVFVNHAFDVWESWVVEGRTLEECTLTNSRFRGVSLDVSIEVLAAVGEEDGVVRWLC